jgi:CBS-domain-containing membrane protein
MDISNILEEPLIVDFEDSVSKVASRMLKERRHEALVTKEGSYEGIVLVSDIVKKNIQNPEKTKIGPFVRNVETVFPETSIQDAINEILINNFKSLPVNAYKDNRMFIVTKKGLISAMKNDPAIKDKSASDVMFYPYCISKDDTTDTVKSIIRDMGVYTVPVIDENGRVEGIIDPLDLLNITVRGEEKLGGSEVLREKKKRLKKVLSSFFMEKNFPKVSPETQLRKVVELLASSETHVVIVEKAGKLVGMITPKDVLKLFGGQKEGVFVTISGMQEEDGFIKSVVDEEVSNEVKKLAKIVPIQYLAINVKKHKKDGKRIKYSIKARLITYKGAYFAHDFSWDITKAIRGMLHRLEKEMTRKEEKKGMRLKGR